MYWPIRILTAALVIASAHVVHASGVGAAFYQPAPVVKPVGYHSPVSCSAPCSDCPNCQRLGFACVDHATPAACAAEGCCVPRRATFGHYKNNWRRWPGDIDDEGPTPEEAAAEDPLLAPFDEPEPEEEDEQAPPPIEEDNEEERQQAEEETRLELNLPPIPEVRPEQRSPRPAQPDGPPALPFGSTAPRLPEFVAPDTSSPWPNAGPEPFSTPVMHTKPREDAPPPLPSSFGSAATEIPTRLPRVFANTGEYSSGVRQVSHLSEQ